MTKSLKPGERNTVKLLLRCERIKQGGEFTTAEAWYLIADTPTYAGRNRDTRYIHNKYKLTYILKKCSSFSRVLTPNGTSVWVYNGEHNAS